MDGVIYSGGQLIPGAADFIGELLEQDRPFRFLTNNSQRTRRDIMTRLNRLGIPVQEKHIYTCADATATYLARQNPEAQLMSLAREDYSPPCTNRVSQSWTVILTLW